jgi:hypothetical protein
MGNTTSAEDVQGAVDEVAQQNAEEAAVRFLHCFVCVAYNACASSLYMHAIMCIAAENTGAP